jgi:hypothetical protein
MKLKLFLFVILVLPLFFSSCGVITKARYGNGFKLNIESGWFARNDPKPDRRQSIKTIKNRKEKSLKVDSITKLDKPSILNSECLKDSASNLRFSLLFKDNLIKTKFIQKSHSKKLKKVVQPRSSAKSTNRQIDPTILWAAILFYGSIAANAIILSTGISVASIVFLPIAISYVLGFILALIGLRSMQGYNNSYSGKFLAISIIALFSFFLVYFLVAIAVFALFI